MTRITVAALFALIAQPGLLPDRRLTPGATITSDVATVCRSGYTRTVRNVSRSTRMFVFQRHHVAYVAGAYEIDHLIPLELGGSNAVDNLWPEPLAAAKHKDRVEDYLHREVCAGRMSLVRAQHLIAADWVAVYRTLPARRARR